MNYARATATMDYSIASGCVKVGDSMHMWLLLVFKIRLHTQQQQRSTEEPLGQFAMRKYCKTVLLCVTHLTLIWGEMELELGD